MQAVVFSRGAQGMKGFYRCVNCSLSARSRLQPFSRHNIRPHTSQIIQPRWLPVQWDGLGIWAQACRVLDIVAASLYPVYSIHSPAVTSDILQTSQSAHQALEKLWHLSVAEDVWQQLDLATAAEHG